MIFSGKVRGAFVQPDQITRLIIPSIGPSMKRPRGIHVRLHDDIFTEILLRLPANSVLRFVAVCKNWSHLVAEPSFRAAHARRRPREILVQTTTMKWGYNNSFNVVLDAVSVPVMESSRRVVRYPRYLSDGVQVQYCHLLASCDGLLLFRQDPDRYFICNPVMRQWSELPQLPPICRSPIDSSFYPHPLSGEYRIMCRCWTEQGPEYYILSSGAADPRRLDVPALPISSLITIAFSTPVLCRGSLHWLHRPEDGETGEMVAFDITSEDFRRMSRPPVTSASAKLFDMDGVLMAADVGADGFDIWAMEDYDREAWAHWNRVSSASWELANTKRISEENHLNAVVAGGDTGDIALNSAFGLLVYNVKNEAVTVISADVYSHIPIMYGESLVQHAFFKARPSPGLPFVSFSSSKAAR